MGSFSSYQEHYIARYNEISEQMRQYAVCSEDLNEIQNHLLECDDNLYDTIAPVTQDTERQDQDEGNTDTHSDLNESYDTSEDLGIPSNSPNNEPLIVYHALHIIKTSDKPFYAFLGVGVGKSQLIKSIYQAALKCYNRRAGVDFPRVHILQQGRWLIL